MVVARQYACAEPFRVDQEQIVERIEMADAMAHRCDAELGGKRFDWVAGRHREGVRRLGGREAGLPSRSCFSNLIRISSSDTDEIWVEPVARRSTCRSRLPIFSGV